MLFLSRKQRSVVTSDHSRFPSDIRGATSRRFGAPSMDRLSARHGHPARLDAQGVGLRRRLVFVGSRGTSGRGTVDDMRMFKTSIVWTFLLLLTLALAVLPAGSVEAQGTGEIVGLRLNGVVDPFEADYLRGGIEAANNEGAPAVLLEIDTPGGLSSSMREITQAILGSRVPVICYVTPEGARAASAGAFVLLSCPVAAMAPGTNVGAATPVGVSGIVLERKVTNDAI